MYTGLEYVYLEFTPNTREAISELSRASGNHNYKHKALLPPCESPQMRESPGRGSAPTPLSLAPLRQDDEAVLIGSKS